MTTATTETSRAAEQPKTANGSAQLFWRELYLAEAQAYWRRKAPGPWPTEQNGKLELEGEKFKIQSYDEFFRRLAMGVRVFCHACEGMYPCPCGRNQREHPSNNRLPGVISLEDQASAAESTAI